MFPDSIPGCLFWLFQIAPELAQLAQGAEHQYWTDPILCEETQARLEHFCSLGWLPPNFKPKTLLGIAIIEC